MASIQRFSTHGHSYWRIVESYRRPDGKPAIRTLMHLGKADDLLARLHKLEEGRKVHSVSSGAVDCLFRLAEELDCAGAIDRAVLKTKGAVQVRDGLSVGQSLVAAAIGRACHPSSKRAFSSWAKQTSLPERFHVLASSLTSQHFWDQMEALGDLGAELLAEEEIVGRALKAEALKPGILAYDTTNFYTHIASTNTRTKLAQRGHNKQRRHDLRQLGLALAVSEEGQIPLGHALYEGSRPDVRTFAEILSPLRSRLRRLSGGEPQLTLIFDQGAESTANLEVVREEGDHYVTALKPSHHRAWLHEVASRLEDTVLSTGETVRAFRSRRLVHGFEQTVVAVFSQALYDGQRRGLEQYLQRALKQVSLLSSHPRGGLQAAKERVARISNRQYLREVLRFDIVEKDGEIGITPWVDPISLQKLQESYFGFRILATTHEDWSTQRIIEAYRGQAKAERAFRDLKDPWVCAFRPQFHWTDQKLKVHAFIALLSLILARLLLRRAQQKVAFTGSLRTLIQRLASLRTATLIQLKDGRGRPSVTRQLEETDKDLYALAQALKALPEQQPSHIRPRKP